MTLREGTRRENLDTLVVWLSDLSDVLAYGPIYRMSINPKSNKFLNLSQNNATHTRHRSLSRRANPTIRGG